MIPVSDLEEAGAALAPLLLSWDWVVRRAEQIHFHDDVAYNRSVSVHFETDSLPSAKLGRREYELAPLTLIHKDQVTNLDYRDRDDRRLSVLTARDEGHIGSGILTRIASDIVFRSPNLPEGLANELRKISTTPEPEEAVENAQLLLASVNPDFEELRNHATFAFMAYALAEGYPVVVALPADDDDRREIVTYSHDSSVLRTQFVSEGLIRDARVGRLDRIRIGAAWQAKQLWFYVPSIGRGGSYHLTVEVPTGLKVTSQALIPFARDVETSSPWMRLESSVDRGTAHNARLYSRGAPLGSLALATVAVRARGSTAIRSAALGASATLGILIGALVFSDTLIKEQKVETSATLLLLVPTLTAGVIARTSGEHMMTTQVLVWVRRLSIISGAASFVAAGALVAVANSDHVRITWIVCAAIAALVWLALIWSVRETRRHGEDLETDRIEPLPPPGRPD